MGIANTISLLGGLAFFLFGMSLLGEGLKRVAGRKLEMILAKLTSTTFRSVLLGTLVTAAIQSSSATTVMVVGFVNSGIMKLANAIGIIMGANIGTTATGWILVLAGVDGGGGISSATIFSLIAFVGIILYFFCKKQTQKNVGMILLAFSVLMTGMQTMSGAMEPLKQSQAFLEFIAAVSNPFVAVLVGAVVTAVIQSCSASIGILQALSVTGVIGYEVAVPMIVGMCIGACAPVLISAIGANINGRRTAFVYLFFNVAGALVLMIPFYVIYAVVGFEFMSETATSMGIAVVNTIFKVAATVILAPFSSLLLKLVSLVIRDKSGAEDEEYEENLLDERFLDYPPLALEQCSKTVAQMTSASFKNFRKSVELLDSFHQEKFDKIHSREDRVDRFEDSLGSYLVQLHTRHLSEVETRTSAKYLSYLSNLERVSDYAVKLAELAQELASKKIAFSSRASKELHICTEAVQEVMAMTQDAVMNNDIESALKVRPLEEVIGALSKELKNGHVQRVQAGQCTLELGFIFNDCINSLERVAGHCANIAVAVLEAENTSLQPHDYIRTLARGNQEAYREQLHQYARKYYDALSEEK